MDLDIGKRLHATHVQLCALREVTHDHTIWSFSLEKEPGSLPRGFHVDYSSETLAELETLAILDVLEGETPRVRGIFYAVERMRSYCIVRSASRLKNGSCLLGGCVFAE